MWIAAASAARVDLASGKLLTVGADKQGNTYEKHPITGTPIIGFQVPYFEEAKQMCLEAMQPWCPRCALWPGMWPSRRRGPASSRAIPSPATPVPQFAAHYPDGIGILPEFEKFLTL